MKPVNEGCKGSVMFLWFSRASRTVFRRVFYPWISWCVTRSKQGHESLCSPRCVQATLKFKGCNTERGTREELCSVKSHKFIGRKTHEFIWQRAPCSGRDVSTYCPGHYRNTSGWEAAAGFLQAPRAGGSSRGWPRGTRARQHRRLQEGVPGASWTSPTPPSGGWSSHQETRGHKPQKCHVARQAK